MDEQVKICPECGAEYFAHVKECRSCATALISPGEKPPKRAAPAEGRLECIAEGPYERVYDFAHVLESSGIDAKVLNRGKGSSCASNAGFGLFVHESLKRASVEIIEQYCEMQSPELREAEERLAAGLCPACGADIKGADGACPDCGLSLGDACGDGGCGGCGH